jgi:hypothetical protein
MRAIITRVALNIPYIREFLTAVVGVQKAALGEEEASRRTFHPQGWRVICRGWED